MLSVSFLRQNLSICIITKNEAHKLEKCLRCAKKLGAEIVVADTGSTDNTLEVAEQYADIVGYFTWCDHFAKAKNYAASLASHDWILTVDSDEYIREFDLQELERFIQGKTDVRGEVFRKNLFKRDGDERASTTWIPRLYHRKVFGYQGRIHEQLRRLDGREEDYIVVKKLHLTMDHDGYEGTKEERSAKAKRNEKLLLLDLEEFGENPYTLFNLGKSCFMAHEYAKAADYFSRGLEFDLDPRIEYVIDMVETYGYALLNSGQADVALGLESVYDTFGNTADFVCMMGLVYMNNGLIEQAVEQFQRAARMPEGRVAGVNSYVPNYNLGVIYECLGRTKEAEAYYRKCGNYGKARERLRQL